MSVYAKKFGRTGNQLFQKAAAIGYAMKHGLEYSLDGNRPRFGNPQIHHIRESTHHFNPLTAPAAKHVILEGYFQSEKYFAHCRNIVQNELCPPITYGLRGWCSIHLRRGDYLLYPDKHPVITAAYLDKAIEYICDNTGVNRFIVFSDDIPYTQSLINSRIYYGCEFSYSEGQSEWADLTHMACAEHHIIANSTFSWWGAWFGWNPNKVVVSPSKDNWFGPGNASLDTRDLIPDSWIQIKY